MRFFLTAFLCLVVSPVVAQNYGEPNGTFPNWQERAMADGRGAVRNSG